MFISPYDTTVGTKLKGIDRIRTAIEVAYVGGLLSAPGEESGVNTPVLEVIGNKIRWTIYLLLVIRWSLKQ